MFRPSRRSALVKTLLFSLLLLLLCSCLPKTALLASLLTDQLYSSGIVHSDPIVCDDCFQYSPVYSIDRPDLCDQSVFLLILITSRPSNTTHRQAIRETWASRGTVRGATVRVAFLTGLVDSDDTQSLLVNESRIYGDIIQADFVDSYRNLTYKSITALQYAMRSCSGAKFLLKADDDTFVNIERLVAYLWNLDPLEDFIGGNCFTSRPIRDKTSKWYVKPSEYTKSFYPIYCNGFSYVMPMTTVAKLVRVQPNVPFLYIEDVYITGMCRNVLKIPYRNMMSFVPDLVHVKSRCDFVYYISTAHYVNETMLYSLHSTITDTEFIKDCLARRRLQIHPVLLTGIVVILAVLLYSAFRRYRVQGHRVVIYRPTHIG